MGILNPKAFTEDLGNCESIHSYGSSVYFAHYIDCNGRLKNANFSISLANLANNANITLSYIATGVSFSAPAGTQLQIIGDSPNTIRTLASNMNITSFGGLVTVIINGSNTGLVGRFVRILDATFRISAAGTSLNTITLQTVTNTYFDSRLAVYLQKGRRIYLGDSLDVYITITEDSYLAPNNTVSGVLTTASSKVGNAADSSYNVTESVFLDGATDIALSSNDFLLDSTNIHEGTVGKVTKVGQDTSVTVNFRLKCKNYTYDKYVANSLNEFSRLFTAIVISNQDTDCCQLLAGDATISGLTINSSVKDIIKGSFKLDFGSDINPYTAYITKVSSLPMAKLRTYYQISQIMGLSI
jgi:hypothetical protein